MSALAPLFAFPVAVWTVLVAISLVYWLSVMSGLVHFGEGADGGAEGLGHELGGGHEVGDMGDVGGHDVGDVGGHDVDAGGHDAGDAGGHDVDADGGGAQHGAMGAGAFRLKNVPITVSVSLVSFFAWIVSLIAQWGMVKAGYDAGMVVRCLVTLFGAPILAFPMARLVTKPLAPLLTPRRAKSHRDLIGQTVTIRTGEADAKFGEALVKERGADLVLRVRVEGTAMKRGQEGVIVAFDEIKEEYVVASLEEVDKLDDSPIKRRRRS